MIVYITLFLCLIQSTHAQIGSTNHFIRNSLTGCLNMTTHSILSSFLQFKQCMETGIFKCIPHLEEIHYKLVNESVHCGILNTGLNLDKFSSFNEDLSTMLINISLAKHYASSITFLQFHLPLSKECQLYYVSVANTVMEHYDAYLKRNVMINSLYCGKMYPWNIFTKQYFFTLVYVQKYHIPTGYNFFVSYQSIDNVLQQGSKVLMIPDAFHVLSLFTLQIWLPVTDKFKFANFYLLLTKPDCKFCLIRKRLNMSNLYQIDIYDGPGDLAPKLNFVSKDILCFTSFFGYIIINTKTSLTSEQNHSQILNAKLERKCLNSKNAEFVCNRKFSHFSFKAESMTNIHCSFSTFTLINESITIGFNILKLSFQGGDTLTFNDTGIPCHYGGLFIVSGLTQFHACPRSLKSLDYLLEIHRDLFLLFITFKGYSSGTVDLRTKIIGHRETFGVRGDLADLNRVFAAKSAWPLLANVYREFLSSKRFTKQLIARYKAYAGMNLKILVSKYQLYPDPYDIDDLSHSYKLHHNASDPLRPHNTKVLEHLYGRHAQYLINSTTFIEFYVPFGENSSDSFFVFLAIEVWAMCGHDYSHKFLMTNRNIFLIMPKRHTGDVRPIHETFCTLELKFSSEREQTATLTFHPKGPMRYAYLKLYLTNCFHECIGPAVHLWQTNEWLVYEHFWNKVKYLQWLAIWSTKGFHMVMNFPKLTRHCHECLFIVKVKRLSLIEINTNFISHGPKGILEQSIVR